MVLLAENSDASQKALDEATHWARSIRMSFNLGTDKSACFASLPFHVPMADLLLDGQPLPHVHEYRYLGALLTAPDSVLLPRQSLETVRMLC